MAVDEGLQTGFYYTDPDQNSVELNVNNYGNEWTATEHMRTWPADRPRRASIDPQKMLAAREAAASPWELHERAFAGEFALTKPYDPRGPWVSSGLPLKCSCCPRCRRFSMRTKSPAYVLSY